MSEQAESVARQRLTAGEKLNWEVAAILYARVALGTAFLSAVAGRFGLWSGSIDLKHFASFIQYTAEVNSFMPRWAVPFLAWAATSAETCLGILLILGFWTRWVALASAALLATFATAMAISFGLKSPMDYSVYSASSAAGLLALAVTRWNQNKAGNIQGGLR